MTDEEKAMTSFKKNVCEVCEIKDVCDVSILDCRAYNLDYEDAYLAGLAEGRKELEKENAELKAELERLNARSKKHDNEPYYPSIIDEWR